ncbi:jg2028 [Pararge aegeria aegeria]|uniref:Jg2028 protein n=1 Tax=Pararge aegeria aegeria TaxID=348720 RepID=A0A8S4R4T6_9NEOP|nr:jg2028 [Pararge aegeria aegeria]
MGLRRRLRVTQRPKEIAMFEVSLRDQNGNEEIRRRTDVTDIAQRGTKLKWQWARHMGLGELMILGYQGVGMAHSSESRWTLGPQGVGMTTAPVNVGRPPTRWTDDIKRVAGNKRPRIVEIGTPYKRPMMMYYAM